MQQIASTGDGDPTPVSGKLQESGVIVLDSDSGRSLEQLLNAARAVIDGDAEPGDEGSTHNLALALPQLREALVQFQKLYFVYR